MARGHFVSFAQGYLTYLIRITIEVILDDNALHGLEFRRHFGVKLQIIVIISIGGINAYLQ
jgi:hypothetical protein